MKIPPEKLHLSGQASQRPEREGVHQESFIRAKRGD